MQVSTFRALQEYLYTGQCPSLSKVDCLELIELANRLCVPRLLAITEAFIVRELTAAEEQGKDVVEDVLMLLEPAQVSNECKRVIDSNIFVELGLPLRVKSALIPENV